MVVEVTKLSLDIRAGRNGQKEKGWLSKMSTDNSNDAAGEFKN
jgi:hypothetical protein